MLPADLPIIRSSERVAFKRCPTKWYWAWRMGLVPKAKTFGALDLGTWVHESLARWYVPGTKRNGDLQQHFREVSDRDWRSASLAGTPEHILDAAEDLMMLGNTMMGAYQEKYASEKIDVLRAEIPLEFYITDERGKIIAVHRLKPDLAYRDSEKRIWLMEHKTAAQIRTEHLVIDDQARPYGAMAEFALIKSGMLKYGEKLYGVMYNFLRKALPDDRERNADGYALNKNGTVSKRQTAPVFVRHPIQMSSRAKVQTLRRLRQETVMITSLTRELRANPAEAKNLTKTPHHSCTRFCQYFEMCRVQEEGGDIRAMQKSMYSRVNPYIYDEDHPTTDIPVSFEIG